MHVLTKKFLIAALAITVFAAVPQFATVSAASAPASPLSVAATSTVTATVSGTVVTSATSSASAEVSEAPKPAPVPTAPRKPSRPTELLIPSITLDDPIIPLGVNAKGEMDVPNGTTNDIGWYEYGPLPGEAGSAVLDAHVFAALKYLKNVPVGADIYVVMDNGDVRHFVVRQSTVYALAGLPSSVLFDHGPGKWLNLITCAGKLTPDHSTYDHRLIVFAELVP